MRKTQGIAVERKTSARCTRFFKHADSLLGQNLTFVVRNSEVAVLQRFGLHAISNKIDPDQ